LFRKVQIHIHSLYISFGGIICYVLVGKNEEEPKLNCNWWWEESKLNCSWWWRVCYLRRRRFGQRLEYVTGPIHDNLDNFTQTTVYILVLHNTKIICVWIEKDAVVEFSSAWLYILLFRLSGFSIPLKTSTYSLPVGDRMILFFLKKKEGLDDTNKDA
jgi:hypothetical protein